MSTQPFKDQNTEFVSLYKLIKKLPTFVLISALGVIYFLTAKWGLSLSPVEKFATLFWPPSGISLAALILFGFRLWPAIWGAAFAINLYIGASIIAAFGIATGNALESVVGAYLLFKTIDFHKNLSRVRDVFGLFVLGGVLAPAIAATWGSFSLWMEGIIPIENFSVVWKAWWIGDMLGILIGTPFLLLLFIKQKEHFHFWKIFEASLLFFLLITISSLVFGYWQTNFKLQEHLFPYTLFTFAIWAPLRFGQKGGTIAILILSLISITATLNSMGPFSQGNLNEKIFLLQTYLGSISLISMVIAATLAERDTAIRAREEFISIASHELKTPLTTLKLQNQLIFLDLKKLGASTIDSEKIEKMTEISDRSLDRINRLVDDMLDVGRMTTGHLSLEKSSFNLSQLLTEILGKFKNTFKESRCEIKTQIEPNILGNWDRERLEQVISNLLTNAAKYAAECLIEVSLKQKDKKVILTVKDHGPGISKDYHESIFWRFERAISSKNISGLGLGLYICRQIIETHQGKIWVESQLGKGTTFITELPHTS